MADIKAQFKAASVKGADTGHAGYLKASLGFMVADTRRGLDTPARENLSVIKAYAAAHPEQPGVAKYVRQFETAGHKMPAIKPAPKM